MQRKRINKKLAYIICLIVTLTGLLTIAGGTSYAVLKGSTTSEKEQIIQNGDVKIELTEHYEDINQKISVLSDSEGLLQQSLNFNIKNIGDIVAKYEIKLVNEVPSSYQGEVISEKYLKIGLEINGEEYGPFSLKEANTILDSGIIYKNELIEYNLRIWLSEEYKEEITELNGAKSYYKIEVEAEQRAKEVEYGKTTVFNYTGDSQEYKVPYNGYYYIEMAGGGAENSFGAKTSGYIYLEKDEKLYFYVGGAGQASSTGAKVNGGYNGGGYAPAYSGLNVASGGGATDVRLVNGEWDDTSSLISRIMVAAGGAGGTGSSTSYYLTEGYAGGLFGYDGFTTSTTYNTTTYPSKGATQTKGGDGYDNRDGSFGSSYQGTETGYCSGGGSGYYGGANGFGRSGGGGSSYISGYAGVNSVEENTTITHTNNTLHYSGKYFIGGKITGGNNDKNGYAKITFIGEKPRKQTTKLNNVQYIKNCINNDSSNSINNWTEIQAIKDGINVAKDKTGSIYSSSGNKLDSLGANYAYSYVTDGIIDNVEGTKGYATSTEPTGLQCFIVDLEEEYDLDEVAVFHYANDTRTYYDDITYVSQDNKNWIEVINETKSEDYNGRRINSYTDNYNGYVQDGLMLWYDSYANTGTTRNTTTTTWKDLSGNNNNVTISGATWHYNYLSFDGTNDYAYKTSGAKYNIDKEHTIEVLLKPRKVASSYQSIFNTINNGTSVQQYGSLWISETMQIGFDTGDGSSHYNTNRIDIRTEDIGKYFLMTNVRNDRNYKLYNKGNLVNTETVTWDAREPNPGIFIGGSTYYFNGEIYSIRVYNKALTEEEILHNYNYDKEKFNLE